MKAVRHHRPGGSEVLEQVEVPDPTPGRADVIVRVEACALNRLDIVQRNGWYQMPGFTYPHIPGMDVAGTVVEVGDSVTSVEVGARVVLDPSLSGVPDGSHFSGRGDLFGELAVIGATADGGYAELCLAPATHVFPVPDDMPTTHAATFPTCWLTAAHGLFDSGGLQRGEQDVVPAVPFDGGPDRCRRRRLDVGPGPPGPGHGVRRLELRVGRVTRGSGHGRSRIFPNTPGPSRVSCASAASASENSEWMATWKRSRQKRSHTGPNSSGR